MGVTQFFLGTAFNLDFEEQWLGSHGVIYGLPFIGSYVPISSLAAGMGQVMQASTFVLMTSESTDVCSLRGIPQLSFCSGDGVLQFSSTNRVFSGGTHQSEILF